MAHYTDDEFFISPFNNLFFQLGCLDDSSRVTEPKEIYEVALLVKSCAGVMERWGLRVSATHAKTLYATLDGIVTTGKHSGPSIRDQVMMLRQALHIELNSTVFVAVNSADAAYYREPRRGWEEIIDRFPEAVSDIEECSKCYALRRYAASVFHSMQVLEHGLLALGTFMQVADPKSGFTAVANALQQIKQKKRNDLTDFEEQNFAFFEQTHATVQAMKDAWRNKISHARGKAVLLTTDFTPAIAMEIYLAVRGFMRRLATELPR